MADPAFVPTAPPPSGDTTALTPLGVPQGYKPPLTEGTYQGGDTSVFGNQMGPFYRGQPTEQTSLGTQPKYPNQNEPQYTENDVWAVAGEPPAKIRALQVQMVQAGLLNPSDYTPGRWNIQSADAYRSLLGIANGYGAYATDTLNALVQNPPASLKGARSYHPVSPLTLAQTVQTTANSLTGGLAPDQSADFQTWYQQQETQARSAYDAAGGANSGMVYSPPPVDAAARAYVLSHDQQQIRAFTTASNAIHFDQMLKAL